MGSISHTKQDVIRQLLAEQQQIQMLNPPSSEAAGYNWFAPETMRWWKSKVESSLIKGRYFISSEDDWRGNRIYCVREALEDGRIKTIKSHLQSKADAKELITSLPKHGEVGDAEDEG